MEFDDELRIVQLRTVLDTTWEQRPIYEDNNSGQFSTKEESITQKSPRIYSLNWQRNGCITDSLEEMFHRLAPY